MLFLGAVHGFVEHVHAARPGGGGRCGQHPAPLQQLATPSAAATQADGVRPGLRVPPPQMGLASLPRLSISSVQTDRADGGLQLLELLGRVTRRRRRPGRPAPGGDHRVDNRPGPARTGGRGDGGQVGAGQGQVLSGPGHRGGETTEGRVQLGDGVDLGR